MNIPYFIWPGIGSCTPGIMVETYPPIVKPKEHVEQVTIPGLPGKLELPDEYPRCSFNNVMI